MNLARESFYTLIFQISGLACATVAGIITARALGPENKGILTMAMLCPYFFFVVFNPTIEVAIIHHMGRKNYQAETFAGSALILAFIFSLIALILFFATSGIFGNFLYKGIGQKYLMLTVSSVPFYFMLYYFSSILRGSMNVKGYNISNQLMHFSNVTFILMFLIWKLNVLEAIIAGISGIVLGGLYASIEVLRATRGVSFVKKLTATLLKDGCKLYVGSVATFISFQVNFFILNYYADPSEIGFYSVAYMIANILLFFGISLEIGLYPKIAHATIDEAIELTEVSSRQMLLITGVAALAMALCSKYIVLAYGGRLFLPSVKPLLLLLPGMVIAVVPKVLGALWLRKGWFFQLTLIAVSASVMSLILNFMLIPKFGSNGAAVATSLTYGFIFLIEIVLYAKYVKKDLFRLFVPARADMEIYRNIIGIFRR